MILSPRQRPGAGFGRTELPGRAVFGLMMAGAALDPLVPPVLAPVVPLALGGRAAVGAGRGATVVGAGFGAGSRAGALSRVGWAGGWVGLGAARLPLAAEAGRAMAGTGTGVGEPLTSSGGR